MRQRCKVARRANGTLFRDHRDHAFFQHVFDEGDDFKPHAGSAATERNQLQRHDEAHDIFRKRFADAAAMRQDQIALERGDIARRNTDRGKLSEAGIDAVNGFVPCCDFRNASRSLFDACVKSRVDADGETLAIDCFKCFKRHAAGLQYEGHGKLPKSASRKT